MQKTSYAIFNRIYVRLGLVAALVGGVPLSSHAAHATLSPPPGWNAGGSALWSPPSNSFAAQTANQWINNAAKTSAMLNVGGKQIAINASLKLGPSAPKVIAALIFSNPTLRVGVGIATWLGTGKVLYDAASGTWGNAGASSGSSVSDGQEYSEQNYYQTPWRINPELACYDVKEIRAAAYPNIDPTLWSSSINSSGVCVTSLNGMVDRYFNLTPRGSSSCPAGWHISGEACTEQPAPSRPLTQQEMVRLLNPENQIGWPMPDTVPNELPVGTPLPVELPIVNPSTGVDPFGRPQFIPTGDPVRNPNYDSSKPMTADNQPFLQPGVNVTPRPTTSNPWQVDIQPVNRPQTGADPLPEDQQNPDTQEGDQPKEEDSKSLCEKHPDILACAKPELDTPDGDIPRSNRDVSLQEENLFGGGSCPADIYFSPHGLQQLKVWDWNKACGDITTYLKPILLICCTFAAFMILVPGRTE